jgi:DNA polymerase-3 subunit alpha
MTLAEADVLRRGMSGKYRSREEFQRVRDTFFANCTARGILTSESAEVWRQIESFAGYSFAKGHSASYAVESFQSLYLKAHYPLEFMVGVINNFGGFYSTEVYVHEARMAGADIQAPCINHSGEETRIVGKTIYLGLGLVQSLEERSKNLLLNARSEGPFASLADLADRVPLSLEQTKLLIKVGALRCTGKTKKELYWEAHLLLGKTPRPTDTAALFQTQPPALQLPPLRHHALEDAYDELELLSFALCNPFELVDADLTQYPLRARHLEKNLGKTVTVAGYLVTTKPTRTRSGERMGFGTFLDADGQWLDTTHFPAVYRQYPFRGRAVYLITGTVDDDFGVKTITVQHMERLGVKQLEGVEG